MTLNKQSWLSFFRLLRAVAVVLAIGAGSSMPAFAGAFEDAVAQFAEDSFADSEEAVNKLAVTGNPLAYTIIRALQDGRLYADQDSKKVYVKAEDGKSIDAATGNEVAEIPDGIAAVAPMPDDGEAIPDAVAGGAVPFSVTPPPS